MYKYYFEFLLRLRLTLLKYLHLLFFSLWCLPPNKNAEVTEERCLICSCCSVACCILFCSKWHNVPSGLPYCQIHYLYITLLVNQWTKMQDSFFSLSSDIFKATVEKNNFAMHYTVLTFKYSFRSFLAQFAPCIWLNWMWLLDKCSNNLCSAEE